MKIMLKFMLIDIWYYEKLFRKIEVLWLYCWPRKYTFSLFI